MERTSLDFVKGENVSYFKQFEQLWKERGATISSWMEDGNAKPVFLVVECQDPPFSEAIMIYSDAERQPVLAWLETEWAKTARKGMH